MLTKGELAEIQLGSLGITYDTAVPQLWIDDVCAVTGCDYHEFLGGIVWAYPDGNMFGLPFPMDGKAAEILHSYNVLKRFPHRQRVSS